MDGERDESFVALVHAPASRAAYQRKTVELARRCGEVSGKLLSHISTADTARDLVSTFMPLRLPLTWPKFAADLNAAANGDASALETEARAMQTPEALSESTTSAAISCDDGPARLSSSAWPQAIARFTHSGKLWGPVLGWWLWAPCASHWPAHSTDRYTGAVETPRPRPRSC